MQQTNVTELVINKKKWDRLNKAYQTIINTTCNDAYLWSSIKTNEIQAELMLELKKNGAIFIKWEDSELKKLENAWNEVADEISDQDPLFSKVYAKYETFREKYAIWGDRAYLK